MPRDIPASAIEPERVLDIAMDLLHFDTQNPPGATRDIAAWVETFFADQGLDTAFVATDPAMPNVLATIPGTAERTVLYNGHLDTVPYDREQWSRDPLGERDGDRLYGRGATDMKGPLAAMLHAAELIADADSKPPVDLSFAIVSDEETGGTAGVEMLLEENHIHADCCVIGETTATKDRQSVTVADRGSIWLTIRADGTAAHGSRPMLGDNAIDRLWDAVTTLRTRLSSHTLDLPTDFAPIQDESVAYYESIVGEEMARRLFERPTVNLGTIEGGESINTVPSTATARLDIRLSAGVETSEILADIRACLEEFPAITVEDVSWSVGTYEPTDSPLVEAVTAAVSAVVDGRVYRRSATGGGDAKKFRQAGIPAVDFGFGTDTVHAVDEYTTLGALERNATVYTRLPYLWSTETG